METEQTKENLRIHAESFSGGYACGRACGDALRIIEALEQQLLEANDTISYVAHNIGGSVASIVPWSAQVGFALSQSDSIVHANEALAAEMREQIEALKSSQPLPGSRLFSALEVIDELEQKWDEARAELVARSLTEEDSIAKIKALAAEVQTLTDIIDDIYTQYDGGTDCYEWDSGEAGAHIGIAIQIDAETEKRIIALLNEKRPSNVAIDQPCQAQAKCACRTPASVCGNYGISALAAICPITVTTCSDCDHDKACHAPADQQAGGQEKCVCDLQEVAEANGQEAKVEPPCSDFTTLAGHPDYCSFCEHARACHTPNTKCPRCELVAPHKCSVCLVREQDTTNTGEPK